MARGSLPPASVLGKRTNLFGLTQQAYDDLLLEIKDRFTYCKERWEPIRKEARLDMKCVAGDPWDPVDRDLREKASRPCLTFDEITQYLNQVINELKANKLAVKFSPAGDGANDETAEFYGNKMREIEYRSNASEAYVHGATDMIQRGYGYVRMRAGYQGDDFDQELWVDEIPNPDCVFPDPDAQSRVLKDANYLYYVEEWSARDYLDKWPKAEIRSFDSGLLRSHKDWILPNDRLQVAEYWRKTQTDRERLLVTVGRETMGVWADTFAAMPAKQQKAANIVKRRLVPVPTVTRWMTNGVELLEKSVWPGKSIPWVSFYGKVLYVDTGSGLGAQRVLMSMVRMAREPFMAYCFYRTCEMENVGQTTKTPFLSYRGQMNTAEKKAIAKSLHEPVANLEFGAYTDQYPQAAGASPLPLPQRNVSEPAIAALSAGAEQCRRAIQSAMGMMPMPTDAQKVNDKSGRALKQIETAGQRGAFHFTDAWKQGIQRVGELGEEVFDVIHDTEREVDIVMPDGTPKRVWINSSPKTRGKDAIGSIKGRHAVTISAGPDYASERDEASRFADVVVESQAVQAAAGPQKWPKIVAKAIQLKAVGPIGDQIAKLLDPQLEGENQPVPPEVLQEKLVEANQVMKLGMQENQQLKQILQQKQIEAQTTLHKTKLEILGRLSVARISAGAKVNDTEVSAQVDLEIARMVDETKRLALMVDKREGELDRGHQLGLTGVQAAVAGRDADQAHARTMEMTEYGADREDERAERDADREADLSAS